MATGNFVTMENFPLYVSNEKFNEANYAEQIFICNEIQDRFDDFNADLLFFEVSLKEGYFEGVQFYVKDKEDFGKNMSEWNNKDCWYYFDMCRSVTIRKYNSEINKVNKFLKKIASEWNFVELCVVGRFSNGEVVYNRV